MRGIYDIKNIIYTEIQRWSSSTHLDNCREIEGILPTGSGVYILRHALRLCLNTGLFKAPVISGASVRCFQLNATVPSGLGSWHRPAGLGSRRDSSSLLIPGHPSAGAGYGIGIVPGCPGCTGPIRYGRIISLSSCSTMWQCQTNCPGLLNCARMRVTWPG